MSELDCRIPLGCPVGKLLNVREKPTHLASEVLSRENKFSFTFYQLLEEFHYLTTI